MYVINLSEFRLSKLKILILDPYIQNTYECQPLAQNVLSDEKNVYYCGLSNFML